MRAYLLSMLLVVGVVGLVPRTVRAQEPCPEHMDPTIAAWSQCVNHAIEMGHIDNQGIANGLLSKLDAAQAAEDRGQDQCSPCRTHGDARRRRHCRAGKLDDSHS